jgi:curli biogenesis system outer membrane secretion channel CsgG
MRTIGIVGMLACSLALSIAEGATGQNPANADASATAPASARESARGDERVAVAIYDFRSSVTEISARGATDMFIDALVRSRQFRVVERSQLNQSLLMEKQLAAQGIAASGNDQKLRAARYLFEGTISEANPSESQHSGSFDIAGMSIGGGRNKDVIGVDVRVVDAQNGDVLDTISVRKPVKSTSASVSGVGNLVGTVLAQRGKSTTYTPNVDVQQQRKESLDVTLRALIDEAVTKLAARF